MALRMTIPRRLKVTPASKAEWCAPEILVLISQVSQQTKVVN
jgi:hypothetical protein